MMQSHPELLKMIELGGAASVLGKRKFPADPEFVNFFNELVKASTDLIDLVVEQDKIIAELSRKIHAL